jgi:hypothetical protein
MKRPTTRRGRQPWIRTAASLLCLWLGAASAAAQELPPPEMPPRAGAPVLRSAGEAGLSPLAERPTTAVYYFEKSPGGNIQQVQSMRGDEGFPFTVTTELPGPERLFRRQSEQEFFNRIREESRSRGGRTIFPEETPLTKETYKRRIYPQIVRTVEPSYVCHGRLLFEQPNFERAGWDLGILTPFVNLGVFYYDVALLPYHAWTRPFQQTDCSAGKSLPGDATPLYLYLEEFSVSGLVGEAAVVTGLFFLFP